MIVEQLSTVNSSLTELNGNLTSNCKCSLQWLIWIYFILVTKLSESSVSMQVRSFLHFIIIFWVP